MDRIRKIEYELVEIEDEIMDAAARARQNDRSSDMGERYMSASDRVHGRESTKKKSGNPNFSTTRTYSGRAGAGNSTQSYPAVPRGITADKARRSSSGGISGNHGNSKRQSNRASVPRHPKRDEKLIQDLTEEWHSSGAGSGDGSQGSDKVPLESDTELGSQQSWRTEYHNRCRWVC